jgi:signal transduction histidine kinase
MTDGHKGTILAIDDESDSLRLLTDTLSEQGYRVRPANSGPLALASVAVERPELILLDMRMPGMDGFEVCRRLKQSEKRHRIPLIFISASNSEEEHVKALSLGAVDFITKPFRREELLARVRTHLELGRLQTQLEEQVAERTAALRAAVEQLRRAQEEAIARQKLESMGAMARGIGHDFGNLLGSILASAELAATERDDGLPFEDELQRIKLAATRGAELVHELMIYAGDENPAFEPVDIATLVNEMLHLLRVAIPKRLTLKIDHDKDLPAVSASPSQLRQILMNLISNASDATGEQPGEIHVSTQLVRLSDGSAGVAKVPVGDYLCLQVSDTGSGMTREVQARIFDPFFSTKNAGRGLGLAVVQGIVRTHGGAIKVTSEPGMGTTFKILLPCASVPVKRDLTAAGRLEPLSASFRAASGRT